MYELYLEDIGIISAGVFYKSITDPIFKTITIGDYNGNSGVSFFTPSNGGDASLWGAEATINKRFTSLPGLLANVGVMSNITLMDSKMEIEGRSDKAPIPRQADLLYNIALYYDDEQFSTRFALNYKDAYVEEHGGSAATDTYYGEYTSFDWSASYQLNDNFMFYAEINNLGNEPLQYYLGTPERPLQVEYYGRRGQVGFKYTY